MSTILLADDSVTIRRVIELTFADEGVRVVAVADGEQAIACLETDPPDIVLADIGMPKVDGYAVATYVKQSPALRHISVLLLTGAFEPIDESRARATGCDGVLVKPFEPQLLVTRVRELLAGRHSPTLWPADLPRAEGTGRAPAATAPIAPPVVRPVPSAPAPAMSAAPSPSVGRIIELGHPFEAPTSPPAFESAMDQLDAAFAMLEPSAPATELDHKSASEFARDLHELRGAFSQSSPAVSNDWTRAMPTPAETPGAASDGGAASRAPLDFGDWDLPAAAPDPPAPLAAIAAIPVVHVPVVALPPPATAGPVSEPAPAPPAPVVAEPPVAASVAAPAKVSMANAFAALLAAEQLHPTYRAPITTPAISEAAIEEVVRRVLTRMTDDIVHKTVLDTAERLIREEIDRLKTKVDH